MTISHASRPMAFAFHFIVTQIAKISQAQAGHLKSDDRLRVEHQNSYNLSVKYPDL